MDTYIFLGKYRTSLGWQAVWKSRRFHMLWRDYGNTLQYFDYAAGTSTVVQTGESELTASFANGDVLDMGIRHDEESEPEPGIFSLRDRER